jgi:hypothetical protein
MPFVSVQHDIAAPADLVWRVLTDFAAYPGWHPILTVRPPLPELVTGARLDVALSGGTAGDQTFTAEVDEVRPARLLIWTGGQPGVFLGRHTYALDPLPGNATRFTDTEEWTGTLAGTVLAEHGPAITAEYRRTAAALAARCELLAADLVE